MSRKNVYKLPVVEKSFVLESKYTTLEEEEKRKKQEEELENIRKESYQKGWDDALEKNREDVELICQSMNKAIEDLKQERDTIWSKCEKEIIKLTFAVAKKTIYEEVSENNSKIVEKVVGTAINRVKEKKIIKVHMNPNDVENLESINTIGLSNPEEAYDIENDDSISRGGCKVITDCGGVDATIETRWNEIVSEFAEHDLETEGKECL